MQRQPTVITTVALRMYREAFCEGKRNKGYGKMGFGCKLSRLPNRIITYHAADFIVMVIDIASDLALAPYRWLLGDGI